MPIKFVKMPSLERLDELLQYDPEDGQLRWKVSRGGTKAGSIAGHIQINKKGRREWRVAIDGKYYISARIIWALYYRQDPESLSIDHVNRDTLDNRIANLRLATAHEQALNMSTTSPTTAARYPGLAMGSCKNGRQRPYWNGRIWISGHPYYFGSATVNSIDDPPPDWLIARSARLFVMRDNPEISDADLIEEITRLKRVPPVAPAAE